MDEENSNSSSTPRTKRKREWYELPRTVFWRRGYGRIKSTPFPYIPYCGKPDVGLHYEPHADDPLYDDKDGRCYVDIAKWQQRRCYACGCPLDVELVTKPVPAQLFICLWCKEEIEEKQITHVSEHK